MISNENIKNFSVQATRKHRPAFEQKKKGFEDRGILNSEMLLVCSAAEELGVEVFIESGRWLGQSTEVLSNYFANKPVIIESVEIFRDINAIHVEKKLGGRNNLRLHYGDANITVPSLVKKHKGKKIAILFDGPKGGPAIDIFQLCLTYSNTIVAGFFHDMRKHSESLPNNSRAIMEKVFPTSFYTDDEDFVKEFQALDQDCQVALWRPNFINGKKIGSYGPTIGFTPPTVEDIKKSHQKKFFLLTITLLRTTPLIGIKFYHWFRDPIKF